MGGQKERRECTTNERETTSASLKTTQLRLSSTHVYVLHAGNLGAQLAHALLRLHDYGKRLLHFVR